MNVSEGVNVHSSNHLSTDEVVPRKWGSRKLKFEIYSTPFPFPETNSEGTLLQIAVSFPIPGASHHVIIQLLYDANHAIQHGSLRINRPGQKWESTSVGPKFVPDN